MKLGNGHLAGPDRTSLPRKVADLLRQEIRVSRKPGDRLEGMQLLRQRFGVSINTVSAALDLLVAEGAVDKRHGSGVYVAQRTGGRRIGILSELNLLDPRIGPFFRAEADALKSQLIQKGDEPVLYVGDAVPGDMQEAEPTCQQFWNDATLGHLDGAIVLSAPGNATWEHRIKTCPIPAVGFFTAFTINFDYEGLIEALVNRLVAAGCRRIGMLAWHQGDYFRTVLTDYGLTVHDDWIRCDLDPALRGAGWDEFREIWVAGTERPDGLLILDDMLFADAQLAMFELGVRVPRDLKLALQTTRGAPPPTRLPATVFEIDPDEVATAHLTLLDRRMAGGDADAAPPVIAFHEQTAHDGKAAFEDEAGGVVAGAGCTQAGEYTEGS